MKAGDDYGTALSYLMLLLLSLLLVLLVCYTRLFCSTHADSPMQGAGGRHLSLDDAHCHNLPLTYAALLLPLTQDGGGEADV